MQVVSHRLEEVVSSYQLTYQDKAYEFTTWESAQEFLDKLSSRVGVEIVNAPLLFRLLNAPGAPATNWREIVNEINSEIERATTTDYRVSLLKMFMTTMDFVEATIIAEDLEKFREARRKHYKAFLVQEAFVGEHLCIETLDVITQREIAAGRMAPDDSLRQAVVSEMAASHSSCAEVNASSNPPPLTRWRRALGWLRRN